MKGSVSAVTCLLISLAAAVSSFEDPYKVLGIHRSASILEIRKAYKQLAKEWHPDKNDDPAAEDKFVEISKAYELLTDPERRKLFDTFGRVEEARPRAEPQFRRYDTFDDIFASSGFKFRFSDRDITLFHKLSITARAYENNIIPKSYRTPHLILFYSDWCFPCLQVEPVWRRIMEELEPIGIGIATVHAENEKALARKVGIPALPSLILVLEGRPRIYKESLFSVQKVVEFVRYKLPYRLVEEVTDDNVDDFLNGWRDNKVRALVFQRTAPLRLRYLLTAYFHRDRVAFGHVGASEKTEGIRNKYQISTSQDALLVFNEMISRPAASVAMADIPVHTMHDVINTNYYLLLPRLSSQALLDALCPPGVSWSRKRICVILVCQDTPSHDPHRESLRRFASESRYSKERVRFMYVYQERQPQFVSALTAGDDSPIEPTLHVALLCRRDESHVKYEWLRLEEGEDRGWECYNDTKVQLETAIDRVLYASSQQVLSREAVIQDLIDEQTQGFIGRLIAKILISMEILQDNLGKEHVLPTVSVLASVIVIIAAGYLMSYLMKMEEAKFESKGYKKEKNGLKTDGPNGYTPELKIHDMRAETYNALVHLLRPGCRTILLLCDTQSKPRLLPKFHKYVWPYRKNKALMFATLNLDRGLGWYSELLGQSLVEPRKLNINPRNCVGTVLALNGMRKYFCVYHAKHPEGSSRANGRMKKIVSRQLGVNPAGAFMGFDDNTSESDLSDVEQGKPNDKMDDVIYLDQLLDGLPMWLDRLFEGSTHRYYLNYWPDFVTKK
ncbi:DnaJ domain [Nesidiocoris tenuis]|uniref:DnaJ homolog subfamily C member 16 n=1 Tax=Nesidiocoris tenuis TaxID=355587 RepID=A0ABN7AY18_9HEMI|nr:DnaJ domain [Nesidiocoris tenuis]